MRVRARAARRVALRGPSAVARVIARSWVPAAANSSTCATYASVYTRIIAAIEESLIRQALQRSAGISGQMRRVQTGFVGNYALAIAFGLVLFVGIYLVSATLR